MREIRPSGSEGGEAQTNGPSLPLSPRSSRRAGTQRVEEGSSVRSFHRETPSLGAPQLQPGFLLAVATSD